MSLNVGVVKFRFGSALAMLLLLSACGKPSGSTASRADPPPLSLDDQAKLMDLQKACSEQAARAFRSADYPKKSNVINTYTNHYAAKLGHCFMLVNIYDTSDADHASTFETVEDAFEGRRLGSFYVQTGQDAKLGHIATCEEKPVRGARKACKSRAEWDAYKARYMDAS